jgi:hypothetical protein
LAQSITYVRAYKRQATIFHEQSIQVNQYHCEGASDKDQWKLYDEGTRNSRIGQDEGLAGMSTATATERSRDWTCAHEKDELELESNEEDEARR